MSHVSFYRKWRPKSFEEIIGQDRVTRTLQNAIRANRVVHAYLFAGHRGTGKTTTARILAKALNCAQGPTPTPDNTCANCEAITAGYSVDVIEIDAASNRGIEEIRELRDRIRLVPTEGRYKVYIIDEAHMLTTEAANALLKTLEEPPEHAVLILVTTEPHRLPQTILSRCQRFDFRRVSQKELIARLRHIASTEGFEIEDKALTIIAGSADGSVRDADSVLDQLAAYADGPITARDVLMVLGILEEDVALKFADSIIDRDVIACLSLVNHVLEEGKDPRQIIRTILDHFRDLMVAKTSDSPKDLLDSTETRLQMLQTQATRAPVEDILRTLNTLVATEAEARWSPQPRLLLEIALIRLCRPEMDPTLEGLRTRLQALEQRLGGESPSPKPAGSERTAAPASVEPTRTSRAPARDELKAQEAQSATIVIGDVRRAWARVLEEVKRTKMFCHALLIEGTPVELNGSTLVVSLRTGFNFHVENLHKPENRDVVEGALQRVFNHRLRLECTIHSEDTRPEAQHPLVEDPMVSAAVQLFGAQVVEVRKTD
ncbi:MAG: DNA polymerase III subunit gamma/tau [bacterium]